MKKIIKIICVLLCMMTIFLLSNDDSDASSKKSDGLVMFVCKTFVSHDECLQKEDQYVTPYIHTVRKTAHFLIYALLGLLLISTTIEYRAFDLKSLLIAFIIAMLYACSDEVHQLFVPGRSGELLDVLIDSIGSILGIIIYRLYYQWRRKKV